MKSTNPKQRRKRSNSGNK